MPHASYFIVAFVGYVLRRLASGAIDLFVLALGVVSRSLGWILGRVVTAVLHGRRSAQLPHAKMPAMRNRRR